MLSTEVRESIVREYEEGQKVRDIAQKYSISKMMVYYLIKQKRLTGSAALQINQRGRKAILNDSDRANICQCIDNDPTMTIPEIREKLRLDVSCSAIQKVIAQSGYTMVRRALTEREREDARYRGKKYTVERRCSSSV